MAWEAGGELQLDPRPHTLRELLIMADAFRLSEWDRIAAIRSEIFNKENKKPKPPRVFNPYRNLPSKQPKLKARQMGELLKGETK